MQNEINALFVKLESAQKAVNHFNHQSLYAPANREIYNTIFEETLEEVAQVTKRLVRAFLRAGEYGELLSHVEVGTFPRYAIQGALRRL